MRPVALCYSPVDAGAATELRSYLETNCPVTMEDGVMQMGADLLDSVETGLSFDYVLVLLSATIDRTNLAEGALGIDPV